MFSLLYGGNTPGGHGGTCLGVFTLVALGENWMPGQKCCQPGNECLCCLHSFLAGDQCCLPGGSAVSLGLSTYTPCIPSWLGTSAACLERNANCLGSCLGKSTASLGLTTCIADGHPSLGTSAACLGGVCPSCLGRCVNCL